MGHTRNSNTTCPCLGGLAPLCSRDACDTRQALFFGVIEVRSGALDVRRAHVPAAGGVGGVGDGLHGKGRRRLPFREQAPKCHSDAGTAVVLVPIAPSMHDRFWQPLSQQCVATLLP